MHHSHFSADKRLFGGYAACRSFAAVSPCQWTKVAEAQDPCTCAMVQFWRVDLPHLPVWRGFLRDINILPQDKELVRPKLHQDIISCFGWLNHRHPPPVLHNYSSHCWTLTRQGQERHFQWRHESEAWLVTHCCWFPTSYCYTLSQNVTYCLYIIRIFVTHVLSCSTWDYTIYSRIYWYVRYWVRWAPFNLSFVTCESCARITHCKIKQLSDLYVCK